MNIMQRINENGAVVNLIYYGPNDISINEIYLREDSNMIEFKYGGEIKVIGKVTKDCSKDENSFGLYNKELGKSMKEVKDSMYNLFLPNYHKSFIITPIALYFE